MAQTPKNQLPATGILSSVLTIAERNYKGAVPIAELNHRPASKQRTL